jgi:hypothetical protein
VKKPTSEGVLVKKKGEKVTDSCWIGNESVQLDSSFTTGNKKKFFFSILHGKTTIAYYYNTAAFCVDASKAIRPVFEFLAVSCNLMT